MRMRKLLGFALTAGALLLAVPGAAGAGLLATGSAPYCGDPRTPFARWGDHANYILLPGGSFEAGTPGWQLASGAKVVAGNEPFRVEEQNDNRSLLLPGASSATSPLVCFDFGDWHMRFFARNSGSTSAPLEVDVLVPSLLGVVSVLDGGTVRADGTWDPSPRVSTLLTNAGGLLGATRAVAFRFKAAPGAAFQIDDVYLDPFKSH